MEAEQLEGLTLGAAHALGLSGEHRLVGEERVYVLHGPSWLRWGEYLFDPVRNGEHAFGVAAKLELSVQFAPTYVMVRPFASSGPAVSISYAAHAGDRFVAGRVAIALCAGQLYQLERLARGEALYA